MSSSTKYQTSHEPSKYSSKYPNSNNSSASQNKKTSNKTSNKSSNKTSKYTSKYTSNRYPSSSSSEMSYTSDVTRTSDVSRDKRDKYQREKEREKEKKEGTNKKEREKYLTKNPVNEKLLDFLKSYVNNKKFTSFPSFLKHSSSFTKSGKQGILGTLSVNNKDIVYKISQYFNYVVEQENAVLTSLNGLRMYCPHFCRGFGKMNINLSNEFRFNTNPFNHTDKCINNDVLLMENITHSRKLYRYIKKETFDENIVMGLIKQVLMAIAIAQQEKKLTHYDLHSNNVLIKKCALNSCFLYILDEKNVFLVPTYGYFPIIIDYGFSYVESMDNKPLFGALAHTSVGFTSDRFDPVSDPKLFLNTVSHEMGIYRDETPLIRKFKKTVKKIYEKISVDRKSGWDINRDKNASDVVYGKIETQMEVSCFFKNYGYHCVDILQGLITLPLQQKSTTELNTLFDFIMKEFAKIENEISNNFYNMYVFKKMIDAAILLKTEYINSGDNSEQTVKKFKTMILEAIDDISRYCFPRNINFELLLCALYEFSDASEGILYDFMERIMKKKQKEYEKMQIQDVKDIYQVLENNINSPFIFDKNTIIYSFNCIHKKSSMFNLRTNEIEELNKSDTFSRGEMLYDFLNV